MTIAEGLSLVREALRSRPPSRYALQAAIAAVHAESPHWEDTDWSEVVALYDVLVRLWPSPVVALNRAVAVGFASGPAAGLAALAELSAERSSRVTATCRRRVPTCFDGWDASTRRGWPSPRPCC